MDPPVLKKDEVSDFNKHLQIEPVSVAYIGAKELSNNKKIL